ncbi:hypothetical protein GCM10027299_06620 [Larkinella ripae]
MRARKTRIGINAPTARDPMETGRITGKVSPSTGTTDHAIGGPTGRVTNPNVRIGPVRKDPAIARTKTGTVRRIPGLNSHPARLIRCQHPLRRSMNRNQWSWMCPSRPFGLVVSNCVV